MDTENLIETETGKQISTAFTAMNDVKVSMPQFLQAKRHACHRPHKGGVHHGAFFQVDDELAIAAINHLPGEFLEVAAVEEGTFAFDFHPNGLAVYSDLN